MTKFLRRLRYLFRWRLQTCACGDIRLREEMCEKCGLCLIGCCDCWW